MREDMFKVIVERPRRGGSYGRKPSRFRIDDLEDGGPSRGPLCHRKTKYLNENLKPLYRFLHKSVGRPWNKVYAEVCERLSVRSTVQQHVRDHVEDEVAVHVFMQDGEVWVVHGFLGHKERLKDSWYPLYVHPVSGVLLENRGFRHRRKLKVQRRESEAEKIAKRRRDVGPRLQWHLLRSVWYEVRLASSHGIKPAPYDVVRGPGLSSLGPRELYGSADLYACAKRQLSKKELRTFDLQR